MSNASKVDAGPDALAGFDATIDHAMRLAVKARILAKQASDSVAVATSIASRGGVPLDVIAAAVLRLRVEKVKGRGALGTLAATETTRMESRTRYGPGTVHTLYRGGTHRWPAKGIAVVYALVDPDGVVVYIGRTTSTAGRMGGHHTKRWASVILHICRDLGHSVEVEAEAIRTYKPRMNKAGVW